MIGNELWLDLFRTSLKAHHDYLIKDIQNTVNRNAFTNAVTYILKHISTAEEIQTSLDDIDLFPQDRWWQMSNRLGYTIYAYELALEIMTNLQERFTGTDKYPGPEFYYQLDKIRPLFKGLYGL